MPPRPPLANTVKLETLWTGPNSVKAANVMYALMGTGWTPTVSNLLTVLQNLYHAWDTASPGILVNVAPTWAITEIKATDNGGTTENFNTYAYSRAGTGTGNPVTPNTACVLSWSIPAHYRGGHPRTYVPGMAENNVGPTGGNTWLATVRTAMAAAGAAFATSFNAALVGTVTEALGTLSFKRNGVPLSTPVFYPFGSCSCHGRLDSQRRRLGKETPYM